MSEFIKDTSELSVPQKCQDCPVQCTSLRKLSDLSINMSNELQQAMNLVSDKGLEFDQMADKMAPEGESKWVKKYIRKFTSRKLEEIDTEITATKSKMTEDYQQCDGVLTLQDSKAGMAYTVKVCTSQKAYDRSDDPFEHVPAHVKQAFA